MFNRTSALIKASESLPLAACNKLADTITTKYSTVINPVNLDMDK